MHLTHLNTFVSTVLLLQIFEVLFQQQSHPFIRSKYHIELLIVLDGLTPKYLYKEEKVLENSH